MIHRLSNLEAEILVITVDHNTKKALTCKARWLVEDQANLSNPIELAKLPKHLKINWVHQKVWIKANIHKVKIEKDQ
jgi:hypothetical protein